ncbi:TonB-dependent receptor [Pseudomonas putida]|uniref:TonB-dependent receptor n=1 Tax=Pseudomonas putida TaxID=303 RepID=UPI00334C69E4
MRYRFHPASPPSALTLALALAFASSVTVAEEPTSVGATASKEPLLKAVTVNARKRTESVQDVPTPVTVVDGATLEEQRIYRVQDIQQLAPSVNVAYQHARQASIAIRGLGNNPANDGLEGSTGIYLDNVYLGRPGMAVFDLLDVEQLEVLRGPQGTLFGKNTTAGVLNISTRKPSFTPERMIETSIGQRGYVQTKGSITGPLNDSLAGRLSLYRTREDGATKNLFDNDEVNGGERKGARGQLLWNINDDLNARFIADYNEERASYGTPTFFSYGPTINGVNLYKQRAAAAGANLVDSPYKANFNGDTTKTTFQGGLSAEINWRLPSDFTLTSISAYRWWDVTPRNDEFLDISALVNGATSVRDKQWSQELRLASPTGGFFDYVVGAYYFRQDLKNQSIGSYGPDADAFYGYAPGAMNNIYSVTDGESTTDSYALFGQTTLHFTEQTELTLGIRGTYEEKTARIQRYEPQGGVPVTGNAARTRANQVGAFDSGDLSQYSFSPSGMVSLAHHFNPNLMGYVTLSHGEKAGGINLAVAAAATAGVESLMIGPERANNLEVGFKSTLLDGDLRLNGNLFWTEVGSYQATAYDPELRTRYLTNAGEVRSRGAELEAAWQPTRELSINSNLSYNDVRYTEYENGTCAPEISQVTGATSCDLSGATVPGASKWIFNVNSRYQWELANGLQPYVTGSYSFRSSAPNSQDDSEFAVNPSYGLANFSVGLRGEAGPGQWDASIWLKNAFDKLYYTNIATAPNGAYYGYVGDRRTLGVTARYDF